MIHFGIARNDPDANRGRKSHGPEPRVPSQKQPCETNYGRGSCGPHRWNQMPGCLGCGQVLGSIAVKNVDAVADSQAHQKRQNSKVEIVETVS